MSQARAQIDPDRPIKNTKIFGSAEARRSYHLNKFAKAMRKQGNRDAFQANEKVYLATPDLNEIENQPIRDRDWRAIMDENGGDIYMIMKIGAHQRGQTYKEFLSTRNASGTR